MAKNSIYTNFSKKNPGRLENMINKDGSFNFTKLGAKFSVRFLFQYFINLRWLQFNLLVIGFYFFINILFALVYWVLDCQIVVIDPKITEFFTAFFFTVQTFTTLGHDTLSTVRGLYFTISFIQLFPYYIHHNYFLCKKGLNDLYLQYTTHHL